MSQHNYSRASIIINNFKQTPTKNMSPILYMIPLSPPVRSVLITAKALGIKLQEKIVDVPKGENLTPKYLKMNPQHTVPTFVDDDGSIIWDSNAINAYLVSKYGKNDSLYPHDLQKRAIVDQRLHFNSGVAFATAAGIIRPILIDEKTKLDDQDKAKLNHVYAFMEAFLDGKQWIAGDSLTIADYNLYATITASNVLLPIDGQKYPKVVEWLEKVDALPEVEVSKKGLRMFQNVIGSKLQ